MQHRSEQVGHGYKSTWGTNITNKTFMSNWIYIYPPKGTKHYDLLDIGKYNIGIRRGSFLLKPTKEIYKSKDKKKYL